MKRKILTAFLAISLSLSLIACGSSTDTVSQAVKPAEETKEEVAEVVEEAEKTEEAEQTADNNGNSLTVWCWDPAFNIYSMDEAAKIYKETNPDFELNVVENSWDDIQTKLATAAVSGDLSTLPDIVLMNDNAIQKYVTTYPDLFENIDNSGIDFASFGDSKCAYSVVNDNHYAVPFDNGAVIACYRTDILAEAGYTVDDFTDITWSEFIKKGKVVLEKTGKPMFSTQAGASDIILMMLQSAGASMFDENGNPDMVNNSVLREVMEDYEELVSSGILLEMSSWDQYIGSFTNSNVCAVINGCWIMASIQTAEDQSGKWAITNMPRLDNAANASNYSNNGGSSWTILSSSANKDLAYDFFSKTFAGSVEFYETILPQSGALATYLPAKDSDVYSQPHEFFGGEPVFSKITEFAGKIPSNNSGVYYYEARDAIATAVTNVIAGSNIDSELTTAEETVRFCMGQ